MAEGWLQTSENILSRPSSRAASETTRRPGSRLHSSPPRHQLELIHSDGDLFPLGHTNPRLRPHTTCRATRSRRRNPLIQHRPRCRKQALEAPVTTARQLTIAADERHAFYDSTKALPLVFSASQRMEDEDNKPDEAAAPLCLPPTIASSADSLYAVAYAERLAEHMANEAAAPRGAFVLGACKNDQETAPFFPATKRRSWSKESMRRLPTSEVALRIGMYGRDRKGASWLLRNNNDDEKEAEEEATMGKEERTKTERGRGELVSPLRSDSLRYRSQEPRSVISDVPLSLIGGTTTTTTTMTTTTANKARAKARLQRLSALAVPRTRTPKVTTDGVGKTVWDLVDYRARECPGPGAYDIDEATKPKLGGGKFNMSQSKSDLDWAIVRAAKVPAPGEYSIGDTKPKTGGGRFNMSESKSDLERTILRAMQVPGPGSYKAVERRMSGGKISLSNPKSDIDLMIRDAQGKPSPGSYDVKAPATSGAGSGKFVWAPADPALAKLAKGVDRVRDMNRARQGSGGNSVAAVLLASLKKAGSMKRKSKAAAAAAAEAAVEENGEG